MNEDMKLYVKQGAYWLDQNYPGWVSKINLDVLTMDDCDYCIVGQAIDSYTDVIYTDDRSNRASTDFAIAHGFEAPSCTNANISFEQIDREYVELEIIWTEYIKDRINEV